MANRRKRNRRAGRNLIALTLVLVIALFCVLSSVQEKYGLDLGIPSIPAISMDWIEEVGVLLGGGPAASPFPASTPDTARDELSVHFIDVGQAKAILIRSGEASALIDAGENDQGELVLAYLRRQGVEKLDLLIGTHPHSDHIGGMDTVIMGMDVDTIVMPDIPDEIVPTTKTYSDVLLAIAKRGYKITSATPGDTYELGGAKLTILAPVVEYGDLNSLSAASRLVYGDVAFLFTGDLEAASERDIATSGRNLRADVLDVSHHGSRTSTTKELLAAVSPRYAVISCGLDNSYGHPHREAMEALLAAGVEVYRTDLQGTVVVSTDGEEVHIATQK